MPNAGGADDRVPVPGAAATAAFGLGRAGEPHARRGPLLRARGEWQVALGPAAAPAAGPHGSQWPRGCTPAAAASGPVEAEVRVCLSRALYMGRCHFQHWGLKMATSVPTAQLLRFASELEKKSVISKNAKAFLKVSRRDMCAALQHYACWVDALVSDLVSRTMMRDMDRTMIHAVHALPVSRRLSFGAIPARCGFSPRSKPRPTPPRRVCCLMRCEKPTPRLCVVAARGCAAIR